MIPKDTLVIALDSEPTHLDPRFSVDANSQRINQLIFDSLVSIDTQLNVVPHAAQNWKVINDTVYQFFIKKEIKAHDGTLITAQDFKDSFDNILDPQFGSPFFGSFQNVEKVSVLSPSTLEIRLKKPQASFLTDLTLVKAIKKDLIGSGPYLFVKKKDNTLFLKRNPNHFKYKPKIENLIFKVIKDDQTRALKLKKGELDLVQNALSSDSIEKLAKEPILTFTKSHGLTPAYLGLNTKDPILKNKKIRQAIAYGINREEIIHHLLQDLAIPANSFLSPVNIYHEPKAKNYEYNPEKARMLLKESKLPLPLKLTYKTSTDTQAINIARLISDHLKKVGIEIELRSYEFGTFFEDIKNGNFQLFSLRFVGITDPDIYYDICHSSNFPPGKNRVFYSNAAVDKLLVEGRITFDVKKRNKIYSQIQKLIAEDVPYVNLWHFSNAALYSSSLKGFHFHPQANFLPVVDMFKE